MSRTAGLRQNQSRNTDKYGFALGWHRKRMRAIMFTMEPEQSTDKLDARLEEEGAALAKLQSSLAENKEASKELEKSLDQLEAATKTLAEDNGSPSSPRI
jgi:hypothetical protein